MKTALIADTTLSRSLEGLLTQRIWADLLVRLELIQGLHSEVLGSVRVWKSGDGFYDPRPRKGSLAVALTSEQLGRFRSGPALVRATARGRSQWLRVPPPEVREFVVELVR